MGVQRVGLIRTRIPCHVLGFVRCASSSSSRARPHTRRVQHSERMCESVRLRANRTLTSRTRRLGRCPSTSLELDPDGVREVGRAGRVRVAVHRVGEGATLTRRWTGRHTTTFVFGHQKVGARSGAGHRLNGTSLIQRKSRDSKRLSPSSRRSVTRIECSSNGPTSRIRASSRRSRSIGSVGGSMKLRS